MGLRFRKKVKIAPGIDLNLSKTGPSSVSLGKKGATVNVSRKGRVSNTIGIPGTGLSYRTDKSTPWWLFVLILIGIGLYLVYTGV
jgi:Protein of unknown function (DUF4236)